MSVCLVASGPVEHCDLAGLVLSTEAGKGASFTNGPKSKNSTVCVMSSPIITDKMRFEKCPKYSMAGLSFS